MYHKLCQCEQNFVEVILLILGVKKCRKWEPMERSATISVLVLLSVRGETTRLACRATTSVFETSLSARADGGRGRSGMCTKRQRARPRQTGCRRPADVDRPSLGLWRPPSPRTHTRRSSTSYFGPTGPLPEGNMCF